MRETHAEPSRPAVTHALAQALERLADARPGALAGQPTWLGRTREREGRSATIDRARE